MLVKFAHLILGVAFALPSQAPLAQTDVEYQDRGGRYSEGVKPQPISGYDIEVISVLVDFKEAADRLPDQLHVKFYLPSQSEVYLTVRELDNRLFYWLDKVKPSLNEWAVDVHNEFAWPTGPVLRRLDQKLTLSDLGVLVRLGKATPASVERIAPAILYHARRPEVIDAYLFVMKTNGDSRLSCSVYREGGTTPLSTQVISRLPGGRPFSLRWETRAAPAGEYILVCNGFFLDTNQAVQQIVRFYHKPSVS
jgi:hypothetical protein